MVVEDDDDLRYTLGDWLTLRGHHVLTASDGLEALEIGRQERFDVVVTDLKMPRCDGLHLLSALKARDSFVQVIFLTGEASMEDAIEALREGRSFDFLQKPLHDLRRLDDVIARALAHRAKLPGVSAGNGSQAPSRPGWSAEVEQAIAQDPALRMAFNYMEAHFREPIGLREIAAAAEYSPSYLTNLMRLKTGKTVQQWVLDFKMAEAKHLLSHSDWPIQRIASILGYTDANYFHRQFRRVFGTSPQNWRQEGDSPARD